MTNNTNIPKIAINIKRIKDNDLDRVVEILHGDGDGYFIGKKNSEITISDVKELYTYITNPTSESIIGRYGVYRIVEAVIERVSVITGRVETNKDIVGLVHAEYSKTFANTLDIKFMIDTQYQNKHIGTWCIRSLLQYIQNELYNIQPKPEEVDEFGSFNIKEDNLDRYTVVRLQAQVPEGNIGSMKVLEKNGFELEGILKKASKVGEGVFVDNNIYAIIPPKPISLGYAPRNYYISEGIPQPTKEKIDPKELINSMLKEDTVVHNVLEEANKSSKKLKELTTLIREYNNYNPDGTPKVKKSLKDEEGDNITQETSEMDTPTINEDINKEPTLRELQQVEEIITLEQDNEESQQEPQILTDDEDDIMDTIDKLDDLFGDDDIDLFEKDLGKHIKQPIRTEQPETVTQTEQPIQPETVTQTEQPIQPETVTPVVQEHIQSPTSITDDLKKEDESRLATKDKVNEELRRKLSTLLKSNSKTKSESQHKDSEVKFVEEQQPHTSKSTQQTQKLQPEEKHQTAKESNVSKIKLNLPKNNIRRTNHSTNKIGQDYLDKLNKMLGV